MKNKKQRQEEIINPEEIKNTDKAAINQPSEKKEKVAVIEPAYHQKEKLDIETTTPEEVNISAIRWNKMMCRKMELFEIDNSSIKYEPTLSEIL